MPSAKDTSSPSWLRRVKAHIELDLHPSKLVNVQGGVEEQLHDMLVRYDEALDGVVLAIGRPKISSAAADIQPYFPMCRLHLSVPLVLFTPKPGDVLTGRVIEVGPDFIGLLVVGVINASIARAAMRDEWVWHHESREWRSSKHKSHRISVQSHVRFAVARVQREGVFYGITGDMASKKTGEVQYLMTRKGEGDKTTQHRAVAAGGKAGKAGMGGEAASLAQQSVVPKSAASAEAKEAKKHKSKADKERKQKAPGAVKAQPSVGPEPAAKGGSDHVEKSGSSKKRSRAEQQEDVSAGLKGALGGEAAGGGGGGGSSKKKSRKSIAPA